MSFEKKVVVWILACGVFLVLGAGCTPKSDGQGDPKRRLNEYISQGFAVKSSEDRKQLLSYLTGDAKVRLQSWSDEQFSQAFVDSKRQFIKLAFKEIKQESHEIGITYELTYQANYSDSERESHNAKITNRKLAQMVHQNGEWLISDVKNIKEVVEYKDEMTLQPSAKTASQGR